MSAALFPNALDWWSSQQLPQKRRKAIRHMYFCYDLSCAHYSSSQVLIMVSWYPGRNICTSCRRNKREANQYGPGYSVYNSCSIIYLYIKSCLGNEVVEPIGARDLAHFHLTDMFVLLLQLRNQF